VASHQGLVAASNAAGHPTKMHYNAVPIVIFTDPEIGSVGYTLEKAIEEGYKATLGLSLSGSRQIKATLETEGFAQIVIDKDTGQILGPKSWVIMLPL